MDKEAAREKTWYELRENWCSGCEVCQFEGDGSCGPKDDGFADLLFNAGFDAGYNARGEAGWIPIRTVEDLPTDEQEHLFLTPHSGRVLRSLTAQYVSDYGSEYVKSYIAWMPIPPYTEDK